MKKLIFTLIILVGSIACTNQSNKAEQNNEEEQINIALNETLDVPIITIADFDDQAGLFLNNEVQMVGIVDHVCKHGGKKLLLVNDDGDVHITTDEDRFSDDLIGEEISVNGIVEEFRVDEEYCLQMDEDNIKSHSEGESDDELFERKKHSIQAYRDSMENAGVDHLSYYSLVFVSMQVIGDENL
jgi:hypothetical protein